MAATVSDAPTASSGPAALPSGALPPAPEPTRRSTPIVGVVLAIAAGTMLFGALLGEFFAAQDAAETWPPEGVTLPNVALAVAYTTLLMASVTAQWAVSAIRQNERRSMYLAIGLTVVLGGAFVNAQTFIWSELGLVAGADSYANTVYALTVTHTVAVVAAIVLFVVMGFRALGGQFAPRNAEFVQAAALFWHFVVAVGGVIYFLVWFLEGGPRG